MREWAAHTQHTVLDCIDAFGQVASTGHDAQRVTQAVRRIQGFKVFHRVPQAPTTQATTASQKGAVSTNTSVDTVMADVVSASSTW